MKTRLLILLCASLCGFIARAWEGNVAAPATGDTTVWFVNVYPGSIFYELEGHSALRIKTPYDDIAVNYGMFSFNQPNFLYRFVKGETDYSVAAYPWVVFEQDYRNAGRRIAAHRLNLDSRQKERLISLLDENLKPENREYRYNYVLDNCATRPLRMVELAIGDTIVLPEPAPVPRLASFRDYMRYYHRNYSWYQFGIDVALGRGIDRPIDVREISFAPVNLDSQIVGASIGIGGHKPLVLNSEIWNDTPVDVCIESPTPRYATPLFVMWLIAGTAGFWTIYKALTRRKFVRVIATCLFSVYGLAGLVVAFLVFISVHESTSPNINLLWLNPLCLLPAIMVWVGRCRRFNCWYFLLNFVLLLAVIVLWIVGYQSPNPAFVPMVLLDMLISGTYLYLYGNKCSNCVKIN